MVTLLGYAARFPVTHGYANSQKRCVTDRFHGYARNRVTGYADPWSRLYVKKTIFGRWFRCNEYSLMILFSDNCSAVKILCQLGSGLPGQSIFTTEFNIFWKDNCFDKDAQAIIRVLKQSQLLVSKITLNYFRLRLHKLMYNELIHICYCAMGFNHKIGINLRLL